MHSEDQFCVIEIGGYVFTTYVNIKELKACSNLILKYIFQRSGHVSNKFTVLCRKQHLKASIKLPYKT